MTKFTPEQIQAAGYFEVRPGVFQKLGFLPPVPGEPEQVVLPKRSTRLRQSAKPLMNKLESQWGMILKSEHPDVVIHAQEWRVRIGNGAWFKVDFCAVIDGKWKAWEVKGPKQGKNVARGILALKCAASQFPEVEWILVWKTNGRWEQQIVLP